MTVLGSQRVTTLWALLKHPSGRLQAELHCLNLLLQQLHHGLDVRQAVLPQSLALCFLQTSISLSRLARSKVHVSLLQQSRLVQHVLVSVKDLSCSLHRSVVSVDRMIFAGLAGQPVNQPLQVSSWTQSARRDESRHRHRPLRRSSHHCCVASLSWVARIQVMLVSSHCQMHPHLQSSANESACLAEMPMWEDVLMKAAHCCQLTQIRAA